jgi:hypothetical protein
MQNELKIYRLNSTGQEDDAGRFTLVTKVHLANPWREKTKSNCVIRPSLFHEKIHPTTDQFIGSPNYREVFVPPSFGELVAESFSECEGSPEQRYSLSRKTGRKSGIVR